MWLALHSGGQQPSKFTICNLKFRILIFVMFVHGYRRLLVYIKFIDLVKLVTYLCCQEAWLHPSHAHPNSLSLTEWSDKPWKPLSANYYIDISKTNISKDNIPPEKKSGIYQINCKDCEKIYIYRKDKKEIWILGLKDRKSVV